MLQSPVFHSMADFSLVNICKESFFTFVGILLDSMGMDPWKHCSDSRIDTIMCFPCTSNTKGHNSDQVSFAILLKGQWSSTVSLTGINAALIVASTHHSCNNFIVFVIFLTNSIANSWDCNLLELGRKAIASLSQGTPSTDSHLFTVSIQLASV